MSQPDMTEGGARAQTQSPLLAVSNALTKLHKEHFGRGPTTCRAYYAGNDLLVGALHEALLPAERRLTKLGLQEQVRHSRVSFQAAVQDEFIGAVEDITGRKVTSFASAVDPDQDMVYEVFSLEPHPRSNGAETGP